MEMSPDQTGTLARGAAYQNRLSLVWNFILQHRILRAVRGLHCSPFL